MSTVILHGGAGRIKKDREEKGNKVIEAILDKLEVILKKGADAVSIVEEAVSMMEDNELFNAGYGSVLNYDGFSEMDASIMTGDGDFGGVASIYDVKNPVKVARKVMEYSDHLLLSGRGAVEFARLFGFSEYKDIPPERKDRWKKLRTELEEEKDFSKGPLRYWKKLKGLCESFYKDKYGTVGAVCQDANGEIAAATSTGGIWLKLYGRVGDSPIMGAGTFASHYGGASATGHGEAIMKMFLTKRVVDLMKEHTAFEAVSMVIEEASCAGCSCGLIGLDRNGNIGYGFNTQSMWYGYRKIK